MTKWFMTSISAESFRYIDKDQRTALLNEMSLEITTQDQISKSYLSVHTVK